MISRSAYTVDGMSCGHCVAAVNEELTKLDGVLHVAIDLGSGRVTIESNRAMDAGDVAAAVDEAGYTISA
jgi:copper chaperone